jgi:single-strand selective monofunctional uracil DNA glycosylase
MNDASRSRALIEVTRKIAAELEIIDYPAPVHTVYHPLRYAAAPHTEYLCRYGASRKRVLFLGMNPGPWGMAQTGVPFGEIAAVRDWMGISGEVSHPEKEHPKRVIEGFACLRSEVSGRRFWGLMARRFTSAQRFFAHHFVANYCPVIFLEESGRNRTPDKLPRSDREALFERCDRLLRRTIELLEPEWLVGIGKFAHERLQAVAGSRLGDFSGVIAIAHPSPANPVANRGWEAPVTAMLVESGVWSEEDLE